MSIINNIAAAQPASQVQGAQTIPRPESALSQQTPARPSGPAGSPQSVPARQDQAELSPASLLLSRALSLPDVRVEKVVRIQQALAASAYNVSSGDVAEKLIQTLQR